MTITDRAWNSVLTRASGQWLRHQRHARCSQVLHRSCMTKGRYATI